MKIFRIVVLILIPLLQAASAQQPATVQGIVMRAGTNEPLGEVRLELRRPVDGGPDSLEFITTNSDGRFSFPRVPPGSYRLLVSRPGFVNADYGRPNDPTLNLTVGPGQRVENVRVSMVPGGVISGRVTDNGKPVGIADVFAVKLFDINGTPTPVAALSGKTNDLGEYRIFWLPPGSYMVMASIGDSPTQGPLIVSPDGDDSFSIFSMRQTFRAVLNRAVGSGAADDERHVPTFFPSTVDPEQASVVEVRAGSEARNINIESPVLRTFHVRGRVTGIPEPAPGQTGQQARPVVQLVKASFSSGLVDATRPVPVEADGTFDIPRNISGPYVVISAMGSLLGSTPIEIRDQHVNGVVVNLVSGAELRGRVVIERQTPVNPDPAMTGLRVGLSPTVPSGVSYGSVVGPDGSFKIPSSATALNITTGDYRVLVPPILTLRSIPGQPVLPIPTPLQGAYVKSIRLGDRDLLNGVLRILDPPRDSLEIVIGTNAGSVEGRVQQAPGSVWVALIPENNLKFRIDHKFVATEPDGRFQLQSVPPGDYRIYAWEDIERLAWQESRFMRNYESRGTPVHVDEGRRTTIEFPVIPARN